MIGLVDRVVVDVDMKMFIQFVHSVYPTGGVMQLTLSKWGNSLAMRIPVEMARALALQEGCVVECETTFHGTLELIPTEAIQRTRWLGQHFKNVNARFAGLSPTTSSIDLLHDEARY